MKDKITNDEITNDKITNDEIINDKIIYDLKQSEINKPKEKYRSFKVFAKVNTIFWSLISTIFLGVICGYFFDKWFDGDHWMLICILSFSIVALINFYRSIFKLK